MKTPEGLEEIWCWAYTDGRRNYGQRVNFTARPDSCDKLVECLTKLPEAVRPRLYIPLPPLDPGDAAKINGSRPYRSFSGLTIVFAEDQVEPVVVEEAGGELTWSINRLGQMRLTNMIEEVRQGRGDRSIPIVVPGAAKHEQHMMYWPCFGHLWPVG